ncbi:Non-canonical poly(A) RNA polymerase protein Trf4-1 [Pseudocercospora fuligena]|uniref:Non-canonical poly(A) RNA polymerase protein Trf4-1 n=1 Tax=Pseudocercospora fuligena TaxID=685502 RepID=A0A8H6RIW4_9PEZI|nr:Non-canonical poly(A) RNA polymerase protein Trf4-1 [Pseudocercospora fuligena]
MQCYRPIRRCVCCAHNAYNVKLALRAAFGTSTKRTNANDGKDAPDEDIPSLWESGNWKPLEVNPEPEEIKGPEGELGQPPREADPPLTKQVLFSGVRFVKRDYPQEDVEGSRAERQNRSEEDGKIYDSRMVVSELEHITSTAWQKGIRTLSDRLHQISDPRAKWINQMSPVMQDRLKEKVFDYTPCSVLPQKNHSSLQEPPPWEKDIRKSRLHGNIQFDEELKGFAEWIQPTANERKARNAVVEETMNLVENSLKNDVSITTKMELHGSEQTGLAMPWSDIDIRIWDGREAPVKASHSGARLLHRLRLVADAMRGSDKWTLVTVRDATYPILNAQHIESGLDVQIVAGNDSHAQEAVVKQCLKDMPYLRTVFYAVRTFFGMRKLNDVFTGGLGSYGIFVLLVATLLRNPVKTNKYRSNQGPQHPHATAFTTFFETLTPELPGREGRRPKSINLRKFAISCFPRTKFLKHAPSPDLQKYMDLAEKRGDKIRAGQWRMSQRNDWMPYLLTLQDPANPHNDLGRKTYAIKHILASIATCENIWRRHAMDMNRHFKTKKPWPGKPLLVAFLGRPDVEYEARREKLEAFGLKVKHETGQVWKKHLVGGDSDKASRQWKNADRVGQRGSEEGKVNIRKQMVE